MRRATERSTGYVPLDNPAVEHLFRASAICGAHEKDTKTWGHGSLVEGNGHDVLGPRACAQQATGGQVSSLAAGNSGLPRTEAQTIARVEKDRDTTVVTFTPYRSTFPIERCRDTGRVERIDSDGTIVYGGNCRVVAKGKSVITPDPIRVTGPTERLTPGRFVRFIPEYKSSKLVERGKVVRPSRGTRTANIVAIHDSSEDAKADRNLRSFFGIPLREKLTADTVAR